MIDVTCEKEVSNAFWHSLEPIHTHPHSLPSSPHIITSSLLYLQLSPIPSPSISTHSLQPLHTIFTYFFYHSYYTLPGHTCDFGIFTTLKNIDSLFSPFFLYLSTLLLITIYHIQYPSLLSSPHSSTSSSHSSSSHSPCKFTTPSQNDFLLKWPLQTFDETPDETPTNITHFRGNFLEKPGKWGNPIRNCGSGRRVHTPFPPNPPSKSLSKPSTSIATNILYQNLQFLTFDQSQISDGCIAYQQSKMRVNLDTFWIFATTRGRMRKRTADSESPGRGLSG